MKKHSEMVASIPSVKAYLNARNAMMEKHGMLNKKATTTTTTRDGKKWLDSL